MKTCFFIGHREAPEELRERLNEIIERHITDYGVTNFIVGRYGAFDSMAGKAVVEAKKRHPQVTLYLLLPYHPYDYPISVPEGFDGTLYPPGMETAPRRVAIVKANRYMVDNSGFLIVYLRHFGNTRNLVEYAQRREAKGLIQITLL